MTTKLICGDCGHEVEQEGLIFKCQNLECKAQFPIDLEEIVDAQQLYATEIDSQSKED
jgi:hypothetical protein